MPGVGLIVPLFVLYTRAHMLDTRGGLLILYIALGIPLALWLMRSFFSDLPFEIIEAAMLDGASHWQILRSIVLPLSGPGLFTTAILIVIFAWNEFFFAVNLTSYDAATLPVYMASFFTTEGQTWAKLSAAATLALLPILLLGWLVQRNLVRGLTFGAVKGMTDVTSQATQVELLATLWSNLECIDLSPTLETGMPRWPTHPPVVVNPTIDHEHDGYFCQTLFMGEHTGSHVDAPAHILPEKRHRTIDTFPPDVLIAPGKVLRFSERNLAPGDLLTADDLKKAQERAATTLNRGDVVIIDFGWMKRYWRTDRSWAWYGSNSPGLDESACAYLADKKVRAVACDTIACDLAVVDGQPCAQPGHDTYFLPNDILIVECLANLEQLKPSCFFVALPLKIKGGSGSPIRALALQDP